MSKICIFMADGVEEVEALAVVDVCRRAGLDISMVSIMGREEITSSHQIKIKTDLLLSEVDFDAVDMIVLPGGLKGTENLEACIKLMEQVNQFYAQGKWIAAICAAPSIFGHRGILQGRNACSYPTKEAELTGAKVSHNPVEVSDHVITSRGMGTAIDFGLRIIAVLDSEAAAEKIGKQILYI